MPPKEQIEKIRNDPEARDQYVFDELRDLQKLSQEVTEEYTENMASLSSARREIFKYLSAIAAGAAALAPQILDDVIQVKYFYLGIFFLCLAAIITVAYILSSIEIEMTDMQISYKKYNDVFQVTQESKRAYIKGTDKSLDAMAKAVEFPTEELKPKDTDKNLWGWVKQMDYAAEYSLFFLITGLGLLTLSLTNHKSSWETLSLIGLGIFIFINIFSTLPVQIFKWLGLPMDIIKSGLRLLFSKK